MVDQKECLFCRIISGQIPAKKVYEDRNVLAFLDINPRNPGHTLVIPKKHAETIMELPDEEGVKLFAGLKKVANMVKNGTKAHGISIAQNNGSAAGQVVAHVHFHVIPRFMNEGPAALEAIIPAKKMDESSLDRIAQVIKSGSAEPQDEIEDLEKTIPDPGSQRPPEPAKEKTREEKTKDKPKSKKPLEEEDDTDEFEELDLNF